MIFGVLINLVIKDWVIVFVGEIIVVICVFVFVFLYDVEYFVVFVVDFECWVVEDFGVLDFFDLLVVF